MPVDDVELTPVQPLRVEPLPSAHRSHKPVLKSARVACACSSELLRPSCDRANRGQDRPILHRHAGASPSDRMASCRVPVRRPIRTKRAACRLMLSKCRPSLIQISRWVQHIAGVNELEPNGIPKGSRMASEWDSQRSRGGAASGSATGTLTISLRDFQAWFSADCRSASSRRTDDSPMARVRRSGSPRSGWPVCVRQRV